MMLKVVKSLIGPLVGYTEIPWTRVVMNAETLKWIQALDTSTMEALEVSGEYWKNKVPFASYQSAWYPDFDVCEAPLPKPFDMVFAEQVFEHLLYPLRAAKHIHQMLREDGYFMLTTPFLFRVHASPADCTRWTPQGMKYFLEEAGFSSEKIQVGSWGNQACVKATLKGRNYCRRLHSLKNEPDYPVVVWALAQK
jgi:SAM-dependent methyltransferase